MRNLKVVTVGIVVDEGFAEHLLDEFMNSPIGQSGYYTLISSTRDLTKQELDEVASQLPDDIAADIFGDEEDEEIED